MKRIVVSSGVGDENNHEKVVPAKAKIAADKQSGGSNYSIEVINRAMQLLDTFSFQSPKLTLAQIVETTALPKTTVFRLMTSLVESGLCGHDADTSQYSLGLKLIQLAEICRRQFTIRELALPVMRELRDTIGETVVLSVRRGDLRLQVDAVEGLHQMRRIAEPGLQAPLYAGAASRTLLADMSEAEFNSYISRTKFVQLQKNTLTDPALLRAECARVKAQGYAESSNEVLEGGRALAAPIIGISGAAIGVLDIITPETRYSAEHRELSIRALLEGVKKISGLI
jgi:IclR family KDG regulon transcriptional repressor